MLPVIFNFKVEINSCFFRGFVPPFKGVRRFLCISFSSADSPALRAPPQEGDGTEQVKNPRDGGTQSRRIRGNKD